MAQYDDSPKPGNGPSTAAPNEPGFNKVLVFWGIAVILIAALTFAYVGYRTNPTNTPPTDSYKADVR